MPLWKAATKAGQAAALLGLGRLAHICPASTMVATVTVSFWPGAAAAAV